jgi:uncharacterized protein YdaL
MKLTNYLRKNRIRANAFAKIVQVSPATVGRWMYDEKMPFKIETFRRIAAATNGHVTANDWVDASADNSRWVVLAKDE